MCLREGVKTKLHAQSLLHSAMQPPVRCWRGQAPIMLAPITGLGTGPRPSTPPRLTAWRDGLSRAWMQAALSQQRKESFPGDRNG